MKAYKLFRVKSNGAITPLFINRKKELSFDTWMEAEAHRTKGFAYRPGWHCCFQPVAPHLSERPKHENRVWLEVEVQDYIKYDRPESQGGAWILAKAIMIPKQEIIIPV